MFDEPTREAIGDLAARLKCSTAALQAVAEVESAGHVFALVKGRQEPLIRWEGHYYDKRLTGEERDQAPALGLASPKAGGVANPKSQAARWEIVTRASKINRQAAPESFSIGLGDEGDVHPAEPATAETDEVLA